MSEDGERREFGDVEAAAEAFEHLPAIMVVTEGPELRMVAYNAAARAITEDRLSYGVPLLEAVPQELTGQGWAELYSTPTLTGETVTATEGRIQVHQPSGEVLEIYLDATFSPRPGPDGRPRGTIMTSSDVTQRVQERHAVERELEELRERYSAARGGVRAMQRALLADSVPVLPTFDVAARYVLASDEQAAGGDWFDAVAREDGTLVLVVGDVVGHGQAAAVAMGQLRSVLLSQLHAGAGVAEAVTFLDSYATKVPGARRATVCIVQIAPSGEVEYCTAGHPPPLILPADDTDPHYLPPTGAGPLAAEAELPTGRARLEVGQAVVLYTDGILERPGTTPSAAPLELRRTAHDAQRNLLMPAGAPRSAAERVCTLTIELLTRMKGHTDDITVLAAQRRPAVRALDLEPEPDATSDAVQQARTAVRAWLHDLDLTTCDVAASMHATTELVANVVDHAYLDAQDRPIRVTAHVNENSQVVLQVTDRGSWKLPVVTGGRGLGLSLVRQLVDHLQIDRSPDGTTATVRTTVARSAGLLDRVAPVSSPDPEHFDVWSDGGPHPSVTLVGPLDATSTAQAASYLELALTEADTVVTVDLTDVTLLASAGVDLMFRITEQAHGAGVGLDIVAPNGSPAQHVLSLVRLPHQHARSTV